MKSTFPKKISEVLYTYHIWHMAWLVVACIYLSISISVNLFTHGKYAFNIGVKLCPMDQLDCQQYHNNKLVSPRWQTIILILLSISEIGCYTHHTQTRTRTHAQPTSNHSSPFCVNVRCKQFERRKKHQPYVMRCDETWPFGSAYECVARVSLKLLFNHLEYSGQGSGWHPCCSNNAIKACIRFIHSYTYLKLTPNLY